MTQTTFGRPVTYPLRYMSVGDTCTLPAETPQDVKRIARNASQYGLRHNRFYSCRTDRKTRIMTIIRIR